MSRARLAGGLELEYEELGDPRGEPLLLVMGLGAQLTVWDEGFCGELGRRGFHVVRYDHRDVGLSTWLDETGQPDLGGLMAGTYQAPYNLHDLVADVVGLLDVLEWPAAHVVGASMGGMVAQLHAIQHPERVLSLTSIMSLCEGAFDSVPPTEEALGVLLAPPPATAADALQWSINNARITWASGFDEERARQRSGLSLERAYHPAGVARHLAALWATPNWRADLARVTAPALVIHGLEDPLVPPENGRRTAAALPPGVELLEIEGMGHDIPPHAWRVVADAIRANASRAVAGTA